MGNKKKARSRQRKLSRNISEDGSLEIIDNRKIKYSTVEAVAKLVQFIEAADLVGFIKICEELKLFIPSILLLEAPPSLLYQLMEVFNLWHTQFRLEIEDALRSCSSSSDAGALTKCTVLMKTELSVIKGYASLLSKLLEKGADPCQVDSSKGNLWHHAVRCRSESIIALLTTSDCVTATDSLGKTPLILAVDSQQPDMVRRILQHSNSSGLNKSFTMTQRQPDVSDEVAPEWWRKQMQEECDEKETLVGHSALTIACETGQLDVVEMLCEAGADVNATLPGSTGDTALHVAALHAEASIVRYLLSLDTMTSLNTVNALGQTALFGCPDLDTVQVLLGAGIDTTVRDVDNETAYSIAIEFKDHDIASAIGQHQMRL